MQRINYEEKVNIRERLWDQKQITNFNPRFIYFECETLKFFIEDEEFFSVCGPSHITTLPKLPL